MMFRADAMSQSIANKNRASSWTFAGALSEKQGDKYHHVLSTLPAISSREG
jgi:hypothetical protein